MQMGSKAFKSLQAKWYRKLEDTGFRDIEKQEQLVRYHGSDFTNPNICPSPESFSEKTKYYEKAKELLDRDIFIDGVERRIWALHSIGYTIRKIVAELACEGFSRNKNQVNAVINEFQGMMFK